MIIQRVLNFVMLIGLSACSSQEFAGDAGLRQSVNLRGGPLGPSVDNPSQEMGDPDGDGLSTDDGGMIGLCNSEDMLEDPDATYSWNSRLRAGDDIQGFVNSFKRYTHVHVGALFFNAATARFACQLNGYLDQTGFTQGSFHSPGNNNIYRWDPNQKKLVQTNAGHSGNKTLKSYSCRGKLKDPCKKDAGWIFQDLP
jgi:hypothetical protein